MGHYDSAIADYTKAISIEPRDAGLLIEQGKVLAKVGRDREAIADFSHALDIDNKAVAAFRERGLIYKKLGDIAAAIADLTWFTRFEPRDHEVVRAIEEIQEVSPHTMAPQGANPQRTSPSTGDTRSTSFMVAMENVGGVYQVPIRINDTITLDAILDSGATDVCIPADVVLTLIRSKSISSEDFLGLRTYTVDSGAKCNGFMRTGFARLCQAL